MMNKKSLLVVVTLAASVSSAHGMQRFLRPLVSMRHSFAARIFFPKIQMRCLSDHDKHDTSTETKELATLGHAQTYGVENKQRSDETWLDEILKFLTTMDLVRRELPDGPVRFAYNNVVGSIETDLVHEGYHLPSSKNRIDHLEIVLGPLFTDFECDEMFERHLDWLKENIVKKDNDE